MNFYFLLFYYLETEDLCISLILCNIPFHVTWYLFPVIFSRPLFLSNRAKIPRETESSQRTRPLASTHPFLTIHFLRNNLPHGSVILFFRPLCTRVKIRILRCADVFLHMKLCAGAKIKLSQIQKERKIQIFQKISGVLVEVLSKCFSL